MARHARRHSIAGVALFAVLGGTAYAGPMVDSDQDLDPTSANADDTISVAMIPAIAPVADAGAVRVQVKDIADDDPGSNPQDGGFTIALL